MPPKHPFHCWASMRRIEASLALKASQNGDIPDIIDSFDKN